MVGPKPSGNWAIAPQILKNMLVFRYNNMLQSMPAPRKYQLVVALSVAVPAQNVFSWCHMHHVCRAA